jgi:hypothetical protein
MVMQVQWSPPLDEGWLPADHAMTMPPRDRIVEYHSIWSVSPLFGKWADFPGELNVAGLYWREP